MVYIVGDCAFGAAPKEVKFACSRSLNVGACDPLCYNVFSKSISNRLFLGHTLAASGAFSFVLRHVCLIATFAQDMSLVALKNLLCRFLEAYSTLAFHFRGVYLSL